MEFLKRYKIDLIIFTIALTARLCVFGINFHASDGDLVRAIHGDDGYYEISRDIADGHGFSGEMKPPYTPNPLRTPLYPYAVAFFLVLFKSYWVVLIAQLIVGSLIPVLGRRIALELIPSTRLGLAVGILLSLEPYLVLFSSIFYTETLFIFLFLFFTLTFLKHLREGTTRTLYGSALLLGLATLTKTTVQFLPIALVPLLLWHFSKKISFSDALARGVIFLSIFLLVLSPWFYRNFHEYGVLGMSAQPAYNAYIYLVPSVLAVERGTSFSAELKKWATTDESSGKVITLQNGSEYSSKAWAELIQHPKAFAHLVFLSFFTFFTHDGMLTVLEHAGYRPEISLTTPALTLLLKAPNQLFSLLGTLVQSPVFLVLLFRLLWVLTTILFVIGSILFVRKNGLPGKAVFAFLLVLYFLTTTALNGLGVNARFRMPVTAVILTFAGYCFVRKEFPHEKIVSR